MATAKISIYRWHGIDKQGRPTTGESTSTSQTAVKAQLRKQGITPKTVKKTAKPFFSRKKSVKPADICVFTRQLASMIKAGVPLVQSFMLVAECLDNPSMAELVITIKNDIAAGSSFAASISKHPNQFDKLYCNLVGAGEQSGTLEVMLDRLAVYKEKSASLKAKIKKAIAYPIAVLAVATIVTGILLINVIPQFAHSFANFGAELPAFTQMIVAFSEWVQQWWLMVIVAMAATIILFKKAVRYSPTVAYAVDKAALKVPVLGGIISQSIVARFARTLATTFSAGVPLIDALDAVSGTAGNIVYTNAITTMREGIMTGQQLHTSIRATDLFPNMLLQMVSIGEQSGTLGEMLEKVAIHYEAAVDNSVDHLTALLEPMIMSFLGVVIGGLMIAMYLPIFMMGTAI